MRYNWKGRRAARHARRRLVLDRGILVTCLEDGRHGLLPAGSLVRNERTPTTYPTRDNHETLFDASTDGGRTWYTCGTNEPYETTER